MPSSILDPDLMEWLSPEQRSDPDIFSFIGHSRQASREEKASDPSDWSREQRAAHDSGDWRRFSELRGYSAAEIANFTEYLRLAYLLIDRYGEDFTCCLDYEVTRDDVGPNLVDES